MELNLSIPIYHSHQIQPFDQAIPKHQTPRSCKIKRILLIHSRCWTGDRTRDIWAQSGWKFLGFCLKVPVTDTKTHLCCHVFASVYTFFSPLFQRMKNWQSLLQTVKKSKTILNNTGKGLSLFCPVAGTVEKGSGKTFVQGKEIEHVFESY